MDKENADVKSVINKTVERIEKVDHIVEYTAYVIIARMNVSQSPNTRK